MTTLSPHPPQPPPAQPAQTSLKTHHCRFCNHLLLATTRELAALPRRREPGRDGAVILPLPGPGPLSGRDGDHDGDHDDNDNNEADDGDDGDEEEEKEKELEEERQEQEQEQTTTKRTQTRPRPRPRPREYSILLSTTLPDRRAMLVRREDGFEKRTMLRCGRCRVVVGYFLDGVHFGAGAATATVYLLPGALMETGTMGDEETMKGLDREWSAW